MKYAAVIANRDETPSIGLAPAAHFNDVAAAYLSRRSVLKGGVAAAVLGLFAAAPSFADPARAGLRALNPRSRLGFAAVLPNRADSVMVPVGYITQAFIPWGAPLTGSYPAYRDGGLGSAAEQEQQIGMHHDGMHFFPLGHGAEASGHGLLAVNHEYIDQSMLHPAGPTLADGVRVNAEEVRKEIAAHGVSIVEIRRGDDGAWEMVRGRYNRRITAATPMELRGPVRGAAAVRTRYSPDGTMSRGTLNNCAQGHTPWGTYLSCEENWARYFINNDAAPPRGHARYGIGRKSLYQWETVAGDEYARFDASRRAMRAEDDYRNEPNTFGWVVEIDPFDPASTPKKRTAMGRFAHEGAWLAPARDGRPLVCYMGDDARDEYIYKFVTRKPYRADRPDRDLLDEGTLYVARFDEDGSGRWIALEFGRNGLTAANGFASQAEVLINTRTAADFVGATPMDRPEWGAVHPRSGEVYMTLTNSAARGRTDAASPRAPNPYGHIVRWREREQRSEAEAFDWDIFVLAGPEGEGQALPATGGPELALENIFASPDGLWIDDNGILWIQTDMSGKQLADGPFGNNAMLAAVPETGEIRRFGTGPIGCEVTGITATPDGRTLFINIQHPGEGSDGKAPSSHWPDGGRARPRSATVVITREDGGVIGL